MSDTGQITDNTDASRLELRAEGHLAELWYRKRGNRFVIVHTDVPPELEVFCLIDHTHAPAADLAQDAVMGNRLTYGLGRDTHWVDMLGWADGAGQTAINRLPQRSETD